MICVSISEKDPELCLQSISDANVELAEIRLDLTEYRTEDIKKVFSEVKNTGLIATCRPDKVTEDKRFEILKTAVESGARYVDVEIESDISFISSLGEVAKKNNCDVIISYHNYETTPGLKELYEILDNCYKLGADVAKIAVMANSNTDIAKIYSLYSDNRRKVVLGMGEIGKISRIMALTLGAEFTFAAPEKGKATAPGQLTATQISNVLNLIKKL